MNTVQLSIEGDRQTVVLPKEYQFKDKEVYIKKIGNVVILISKDNPWQILFDSLKLFSEDFMETREQPPLDIREELE
jgi:antitoxin VapB